MKTIMKSNTMKFLNAYNHLGKIEDEEVIGKAERIAHEKLVAKLKSDLTKYGSKITEDEFNSFCGDLCCTWEDFKDCYITNGK